MELVMRCEMHIENTTPLLAHCRLLQHAILTNASLTQPKLSRNLSNLGASDDV